MSFTIVSHNIPGRARDSDVKKHLHRNLLSQPAPGVPAPSIALFQEFKWALDGEWRAWMPEYWKIVYENPGQPFAYDSRHWQLLSQDSFVSTPAQADVGAAGAGTRYMGEKRVQWIHLRRVLPRGGYGGHLITYNLHAVPSIHVPFQPGADYSRDELHEKLMKDLAEHIDSHVVPTVVGGDFNAHWGHSNLSPLVEARLTLCSNPNLWTHAKTRTAIDHILKRNGRKGRRRLERITAGVFPTLVDDGDADTLLDDDHRGVWAELRFLPPAR